MNDHPSDDEDAEAEEDMADVGKVLLAEVLEEAGGPDNTDDNDADPLPALAAANWCTLVHV